MSRHFVTALVGSGILLVSMAANANYLLVTANGTVTSGRDQTNYLGYGVGNTVTGGLAALPGQSVTLSWLLDLNLAGPDILGGSQPGRGFYTGGSCPGANTWLTTTGVTLGGQGLDVAPAPASTVQQCGAAEVWDRALNDRFDSFAVANETSGQSFGTLDDGSTVTRFTYVGASASILEVDLDFIQGTHLGQSFAWTQSGDERASVGTFARQASIENCFGGACASADLINFELIFSFNSLTAQVVQSVPEPSTFILLCAGLLAIGSRNWLRAARNP